MAHWINKTFVVFTGIILIILGIFVLNKFNAYIQKNAEMDAEIINLNKKVIELENKEPQIITKTIEKVINNTKYISNNIPAIDPTTSAHSTDLSDIILQWTPRVAIIICKWNEQVTSGSGTFAKLENGIMLMTNKHVLDYIGYAPNICIINSSDHEYIIDWTQNVSNYQNPYYFGALEDYAYIRIDNPDQYLINLTYQNINLCTNQKIGDRLVILGYPGVGSNESITATEGIISGIESNYYVTSAKIEHGNSGGAAISLKENCYLGIPSSSNVGSIESFGRILKSNFVIK